MQSMDDIYQKYAQMVYRYLLSLVRDADVAEELTQETFYQALRSIDRYDGSCKISTWLCAIAKNQMYVFFRKNPERKADTSYAAEQADARAEHKSAEEEALNSMGHIQLLQRLHNCPEPYREVMYLRIFGNLSFREIGDVVGKTENWARVTFYRGKERLRKELDEDE